MFCKLVVVFVSIAVIMVKSQSDYESLMDNMLTALIYPSEQDTIQTKALRRDLFKKLEEALLAEDLDYAADNNYSKRTLSSLARSNNLPLTKRNLEALARGGHIRTILDEDDDDYLKRNIVNLAKNGQLRLINDEKRGIESLARNGELPRKRELQAFLESLNEKRNIDSLARNYNFPSAMRYAKRSATNRLDGISGERTIGTGIAGRLENGEDKRNIGSIKAQYKPKYKRDVFEANGDGKKARGKREIDYYDDANDDDPSMMGAYQNPNGLYDYDELFKSITGNYPVAEKRFLGSVARSGWFRPSSSSSRFTNVDKRHIGSLARLGWLPSYRSVRRFNRSGRSTFLNGECSTLRSPAANGQAEDDPISENALPLDDKRFLLQPAVDKLLWQKLYMRRRTQ